MINKNDQNWGPTSTKGTSGKGQEPFNFPLEMKITSGPTGSFPSLVTIPIEYSRQIVNHMLVKIKNRKVYFCGDLYTWMRQALRSFLYILTFGLSILCLLFF